MNLLSYSEAIKSMKDGKHVSRTTWNGSMYLISSTYAICPSGLYCLTEQDTSAVDWKERCFDGCEWCPEEDRAALNNDKHWRTTPARVIVGLKGQWRLCLKCSRLRRFKQYRIRRFISR